VDMLDTPADAMASIKATGVPLVTFDDRGPGRFHADAIINVLVEEPEPERLRPGTRLLEGGDYVVLDPIFAEAHNETGMRDEGRASEARDGLGRGGQILTPHPSSLIS